MQRTAKLDKWLARDLKSMAEPAQLYDTVTGKTMCTYDFYEGKNFYKQFVFKSRNMLYLRVVYELYLATHFPGACFQ